MTLFRCLHIESILRCHTFVCNFSHISAGKITDKCITNNKLHLANFRAGRTLRLSHWNLRLEPQIFTSSHLASKFTFQLINFFDIQGFHKLLDIAKVPK